MQDNHSNDFDLRMRSILADAEVKPSRRVWKAVSARLDAGSAPAASPWGWMKWAGLSLAAAAAVAAGVFFSGTRTSIPTIIHNQEQALLAQQAGETVASPTEVEGAAVPAAMDPADQTAARPVYRSAAARRSAGQPVDIPEAAVQNEVAASGTADVQPAAGQKPAEPATATRRPTQPKQEVTVSTADPFAEPAAPRRSKPGASLYAQGTIGSNETDFRPAPGAWMAPGPESGFSELGSSTYGVPFTLGLGVRFYVSPRISLGTGVNYSLLTRSFTGSFDGVSGNVSHTLQYLGIPVNLFYDIISSERIKFYVYGGGAGEYCLSNKYRLYANPDIIRKYPVERLQFSVGGGLGVEFRLAPRLGIYLDPGVNYYFKSNQPRSIRTDKPLLINFDAGLRFNF